jgi:hypothetical protein
MSETVEKAAKALKENPLVEFAVGAGTATVIVAMCWAVVKILQLILT